MKNDAWRVDKACTAADVPKDASFITLYNDLAQEGLDIPLDLRDF